MTREDFERRITDLLPDVSDQAMKNWLEYAENLDRDGTETESEIFDRSYVELALIKRHQSVETAAALFNYGEKFVFNYFELRGAAELLKEGWPLEQISNHAVESGCDPTLEAMEESRTALEEFQSGAWEVRENKERFHTDLAYAARQLFALEKELGGQEGVFAGWMKSLYEINEDFQHPYAEEVDELCGAFRDAERLYGWGIARQLYNTQTVILPTEIRSAAQYLSLGGSLDHVSALALVGFLMESQDHDSMLRAVKYMNDGGCADNAYYAAQGDVFKDQSPQCQQTM